MDEFIPFGMSKTAQDIITEHLNTPKKPSTDVFRNPNYDLRTEQGLPPDALYPNPLLDTTPTTPEVPVDPCPAGYELIDGICQPTERFGQSAYQEKNDDNNQEERPYMSIEDMKNASDYELLNYLTDGYLANHQLGFLPSKLGKDFFLKTTPPNALSFGLSLLGLNDSKLRKDFMEKELARRGYDLNTKQGQLGLTQAMGIIDNAQSSNLGFSPNQINYQIQAKKDAQNIVNQGGNPYAQTMTPTEVIADAVASGGTVNPYEVQNINQGTNNNNNYQQYFSNPTTPADNFYDDESGI